MNSTPKHNIHVDSPQSHHSKSMTSGEIDVLLVHIVGFLFVIQETFDRNGNKQ